ncbi:MAG: hypothetical protein AAGJ55_08850, partial [Cyanobacteria bacterium J06555_12]
VSYILDLPMLDRAEAFVSALVRQTRAVAAPLQLRLGTGTVQAALSYGVARPHMGRVATCT